MKTNDPENSSIGPSEPNDSTCESACRRGLWRWVASSSMRGGVFAGIVVICLLLAFMLAVSPTLHAAMGDPERFADELVDALIALALFPGAPLLCIIVDACDDYLRWKRGDETSWGNRSERED